eukprot:5590680-Prymnesium_polylepis.1
MSRVQTLLRTYDVLLLLQCSGTDQRSQDENETRKRETQHDVDELTPANRAGVATHENCERGHGGVADCHAAHASEMPMMFCAGFITPSDRLMSRCNFTQSDPTRMPHMAT